MKITAETWLANNLIGLLLPLFIELTSLHHRISVLGFLNSKIRYIFNSCFGVLIFTFNYDCLNDLPFLRYKEQQEQHKV